MSRLEKDFVNGVLIPKLKKIPNSWWMKPVTGSVRGIPDLIGCIEGRFVALECKRDGAKSDPSREKLQEYTCQKITQAGGLAFARVSPSNMAGVLNYLQGKAYGD